MSQCWPGQAVFSIIMFTSQFRMLTASCLSHDFCTNRPANAEHAAYPKTHADKVCSASWLLNAAHWIAAVGHHLQMLFNHSAL